jgi:membrane fusion protein (multidrug efflux system)
VASVLTLEKSLIAAGLAFLLLAGCQKPAAPPPRGPVAVETTTARSESVPLYGDWVANTDGYVNAQIQPQVSGYLIRQDYKEGSVVAKDQVLFEIDPRPFQAVVDQAKASVAQAQAAVAQAQAQVQLQTINVNRDTPLAQAHAIAQSQLDNDLKQQQAQQASVEAAEAQVRAAQAQLQTAEINLGFTKVRSLISGIAGQATLQVGNLVSPTSILTSVSQVNPIKAYFSISEQEYLALSSAVRAGGHKDLLSSGNSIPLQLTLANGQVYPQKGNIIFVDRSVSAQTGSLRIAAGFPNVNNLLRPGQFGRIKAQVEMKRDAIVVPERALNEVQGSYQVAVVEPNNTIKLVPVTPGAQIGSNIVIASGLKGGEQVVTEGIDKIRDGSQVTAQPEQAPSLGTQSPEAPSGNQPNAAENAAANNPVAAAGAAGKAR